MGFTLLEVMLALAILIALLTVMTSVVGGVAMSRERTSERTARDQGITTAFELFAAAVDTCVAADGMGDAGVDGNLLRLRLISSRVPARRLGSNVSGNSPLSDRDAIEFNLDGRRLVLRDVQGGRQSVLVENVVAIRFRYHDGEEWLEQWNSATSGLPRAIELAIWTRDWPDGDVPAWMPEELEEDPLLAEGEYEELLMADAFDPLGEPAEFSGVALESDDPFLPAPDRQCIVAVFNPVSPGGEAGSDQVDDYEFSEFDLP
ncbi:MAG: hypothetical protein MK085_03280 [Phycisphaerales bacterium]|nr:hypothetical protein [Phycisphaerales bacterium]